MSRRSGPPIVLLLCLALAAAGCNAGAPGVTSMPVATTAEEFGEAVCSSLEAMARAIGNPDTAADSKLSAALDAAMERGDYAGVEQVVAQMKAELATGRRFAAVAAGWEPGATMAGQVDALIGAFEAMVEAKRAGASQGFGAATGLGQTAFEQAGGIEAWQGMLEAGRTLPPESLQGLGECRWWEAGGPD